MPSVCIIIPCYNEATRLPADVFLAYVRRVPDVRFCFVDDGSTDNTRTVLEKLQAQHPDRIEALILPQNQGKAGAVRAGMLHYSRTGGPRTGESQPGLTDSNGEQSFDYLGFFDADLATPLDAIADLADSLNVNPNLDLVMGSRIKYLGVDIRRNTFRHYAGRIIATLISNILKLPVYDTQCGAKLFRRGVVSTLFEEPFISPWLFDVELLARLIRHHGRANVQQHVAERPLRQWIEQSDSRIQPAYYIKLWYELYRIQRTYRNA